MLPLLAPLSLSLTRAVKTAVSPRRATEKERVGLVRSTVTAWLAGVGSSRPVWPMAWASTVWRPCGRLSESVSVVPGALQAPPSTRVRTTVAPPVRTMS